MFLQNNSVPALTLFTWYMIWVLDLLFRIDIINKKHLFDHDLNNFPPVFMMFGVMDGLWMGTHFLNLHSITKCWKSRSQGGQTIICPSLARVRWGWLTLGNRFVIPDIQFLTGMHDWVKSDLKDVYSTQIPYIPVYKTHPCIVRTPNFHPQKKKKKSVLFRLL